MDIKNFKLWAGLGGTCVGNALMTILPENFNWLGWPLLFVGLIMLALAFHEWLFNQLRWKLHFRKPYIAILIPLDKAAKTACNETIKAGGRIVNILNNNDGDLRFVHMANHMLPFGKLYGKLDGLDFYEEIPEDEYSHIDHECKATHYTGGKIIHYDLKIERKALKKYLKSLKDE